MKYQNDVFKFSPHGTLFTVFLAQQTNRLMLLGEQSIWSCSCAQLNITLWSVCGVELYLLMFLILTVDKAECCSSRPAAFPPGKKSSTRWRGLDTAEKQNILASAKSNHNFSAVKPVASSLYCLSCPFFYTYENSRYQFKSITTSTKEKFCVDFVSQRCIAC